MLKICGQLKVKYAKKSLILEYLYIQILSLHLPAIDLTGIIMKLYHTITYQTLHGTRTHLIHL